MNGKITGNHPSIHSIPPYRVSSSFFFAFALKKLEEGTFRICWQGKLVNEARESRIIVDRTGHDRKHSHESHELVCAHYDDHHRRQIDWKRHCYLKE